MNKFSHEWTRINTNKMKKILGLMVFITGVCFGEGSVTVYNAGGSFNCATDTIQQGINACPDKGTVSCANGIK